MSGEVVDANPLIQSNPANDTSNSEIPIKEEPPKIDEKSGSITEKKTKPSKADIKAEKLKRLKMYIVLGIFVTVSLLVLIIEYKGFKNKVEKTFKDHTTFCLFLFIIAIIAAISLSAFVSYCECIIKMHIFGVLFLIILNALNSYCIVYSIHHEITFSNLFSSLMTLVGGSLGLILATSLIRGEDINIVYLLAFNALGSAAFGFIAYIIYGDTWDLLFTIATFLVSEFNVYSSQYKVVLIDSYKEMEKEKEKEKKEKEKKEKEKKKEILIYSQPFELSISAFKFLIFLVSVVIKLIKCCASCCSGNGGKK